MFFFTNIQFCSCTSNILLINNAINTTLVPATFKMRLFTVKHFQWLYSAFLKTCFAVTPWTLISCREETEKKREKKHEVRGYKWMVRSNKNIWDSVQNTPLTSSCFDLIIRLPLFHHLFIRSFQPAPTFLLHLFISPSLFPLCNLWNHRWYSPAYWV